MPPLTYLLLFYCIFAAASGCLRVRPSDPGMPAANCKGCAQNLIMTTTTAMNAKPFASMTPDNSGMCTKIPYICMGTKASIAYSPNGGTWTDGADGAEDGVATVTVECNAAGTAWLFMDKPIMQLECSSEKDCKSCDQKSITVTTNGGGAKPFPTPIVDNSGMCTKISYICKGEMAGISINMGAFDYNDDTDGTVDMTATVTVECNADGTSWNFMPNVITDPITQLECSYIPADGECTNQCTELNTNPEGGDKDMEPGMMVTKDGCSTRTVVCMGSLMKLNPGSTTPPSFTFTDAMDGSTDGTVNLPQLTCRQTAAGAKWKLPDGREVFRAVCSP